MAITIVLSDEYKWVALALFSTQIMLAAQTMVVGKKRKLAKIKYPQLYAEKAEAEASRDAYIFNCAQRAHQNTLEVITPVITATILTSVYYPIAAAVGCGLFVVGRAFYTKGYLAGPDSRVKKGGFIGSLSSGGLLLGSALSLYKLFV
ncbi:membrane-associated proteins in eicosanoid and glutathione metabolism [Hymenopellis radicata]|nr:membrane-associated proteins in eicosanoid and glutathione metabolism [Hymenopellis radicata]